MPPGTRPTGPFERILETLSDQRAALAELPDVLAVRPDYDWDVEPRVPVLCLAFRPPLRPAHRRLADAQAARLGVRVVAVAATPREQILAAPEEPSDFECALRAELDPELHEFAIPTYAPPPDAPPLTRMTVEAVLHLGAGPDAGWRLFKGFLDDGVRDRMTVGMYQFYEDAIEDALVGALGANGALELCVDPAQHRESELIERLKTKLPGRFTLAYADTNGAFSGHYHIKVAVIDDERLWLSTGNWTRRSLPDFDPLTGVKPPSGFRGANREYHVWMESPELAELFRTYLDWDRAIAKEPPATYGLADEMPLLFVPEDLDIEAFAPRPRVPPIRLEGPVTLTPILTPENYVEAVLDLIVGAKSSIWFQIPYIRSPRTDRVGGYKRLLAALAAKASSQPDFSLRILTNTPDGVARDVDPACIRSQSGLHAKMMVVDGERALVGSHNWSGDGTQTNRDASLIIENVEVASYLAGIFAADWDARAPKREAIVARPGESAPPGYVTVPWNELFDEPPPLPRTPAVRPSSAETPAAEPKTVESVGFSGIDGETGAPFFPALPLASFVRSLGASPQVSPSFVTVDLKSCAMPFGTDPSDPASSGWALVCPPDEGAAQAALSDLVTHRRGAIKNVKLLTYAPGEDARAFLDRHGVSPGSADPERVPNFLLLVGGPDKIPWSFQQELDGEYAVGRLAFDDIDAYRRYAAAVVRSETSSTPMRDGGTLYFGPNHGDAATAMSESLLIAPLATKDKGVKRVLVADAATRAALLAALDGEERASIVFTAGHGVAFRPDSPSQEATQGALLTQDWAGPGQIAPSAYVQASDIPDSADLAGAVLFFFACYGAGTPELDTFAGPPGADAARIAARPFVARLPQRLLGLERAPLAVIGHVDRAWGCSIRPEGATGPQINAFSSCLDAIRAGLPVGFAMQWFNDRAGGLGMMLPRQWDLYMRGQASARRMGYLQCEFYDALSYVILGDPAVRLPAPPPTHEEGE